MSRINISADHEGSGQDHVFWSEGDVIAFWELQESPYLPGYYGPAIGTGPNGAVAPLLFVLTEGVGASTATFEGQNGAVLDPQKRYIASHTTGETTLSSLTARPSVNNSSPDAPSSGIFYGMHNATEQNLAFRAAHYGHNNYQFVSTALDDFSLSHKKVSFWSPVKFQTTGEETTVLPLSFRMTDDHIQEFNISLAPDVPASATVLLDSSPTNAYFTITLQFSNAAGQLVSIAPNSGAWAMVDGDGNLVFDEKFGRKDQTDKFVNRGLVGGGQVNYLYFSKRGGNTALSTTPIKLRFAATVKPFPNVEVDAPSTSYGPKRIRTILRLVINGTPKIIELPTATYGDDSRPVFEPGKTYVKNIVLTASQLGL